MAQHLITSAPPYVTGANYLEHLAGGMLPADIYARYLRQCGHQVLFVCATDEHGAQAELAAADAGLPVAQYCTRQHRLLEELGQRFLLSWDHFGRSSSAENHELTQHFADSLDRNGFLEERETELFLRQSEFTDVLPDEVGTASGGRWLDANLQDRCITRDLDWGIPVGWPGYEGKVFDTCFDSSIEYIGATYEWSNRRFGRGSTAWRSWWFDANAVTYTQFMPSDTLRSGKVSFASTIIGSWEPWKLPDYVKEFNRLTYKGRPFSTFDGTAFTDPALRLPAADYWRWYFMFDAPETADATFTWERFADVVNEELVNGFGRFVDRAFSLARQADGGRVPVGGAPGEAERQLSESLKTLVCEYMGSLCALQFRRAAERLRAIWALANNYLESNSPLELSRTDPVHAGTVLRTALNLALVVAVASEPVIPNAAASVLAALDLPAGRQWKLPELASLDRLPTGHTFQAPDLALRAISSDDMVTWQRRLNTEPVSLR